MSLIVKLRKNINNEDSKVQPIAKTICKLSMNVI
jgi:hypothetical protein